VSELARSDRRVSELTQLILAQDPAGNLIELFQPAARS
jgi:hypothetical protein